MSYIVLGVRTAVDIEVLHIEVLAAVVVGLDAYSFAVVEMNIDLLEEGSAEYILVGCGAYGIEAESREYIPC